MNTPSPAHTPDGQRPSTGQRPSKEKTNAPEGFQMIADYGCYRPQGRVTFEEAVHLVATAIEFARQRKVELLFVDSTKLTGFGLLSTWDRFWMGIQFAASGQSAVKLALVAREELIDPKRFGVTVARNRGLLAEVFVSETDALAWLLDPEAK